MIKRIFYEKHDTVRDRAQIGFIKKINSFCEIEVLQKQETKHIFISRIDITFFVIM